jgi:hypothetical protein
MYIQDAESFIAAVICFAAVVFMLISTVYAERIALWNAGLQGLSVSSPRRFRFWITVSRILIPCGAFVIAMLGLILLHQAATTDSTPDESFPYSPNELLPPQSHDLPNNTVRVPNQ